MFVRKGYHAGTYRETDLKPAYHKLLDRQGSAHTSSVIHVETLRTLVLSSVDQICDKRVTELFFVQSALHFGTGARRSAGE